MDTPQKLLVLQVTNNWKRDVPVEVKSIEAAILCSVCFIIAILCSVCIPSPIVT